MRALVAAMCTVVLAVAATPAHAGFYEVRACGSVAGGTQNAFAALADPGMSAYSICPPSSGVGTGIVTKASSSGGRASYGAGAYQVFTAPPGTGLEDVTFNVGAIRLNWDWSVGIVAFSGDWDAGDYPYGCYPWTSYCGVGTPVYSIQAAVGLYGHPRFRFQTRCVNPAGCDLSASPFNPANQGLFSAANVVVRVRDETPPVLTPAHGDSGGPDGTAARGGWTTTRTARASCFRGCTSMASSARRRTIATDRCPDWIRCDFTRPRPCLDVRPGGFSTEHGDFPTARTGSRSKRLDAAGNASRVGHSIQVDNTIPAKPEGTRRGRGRRLAGSSRFDLHWTNPPGQVAPIVRAHYRLCRAGGGACVTGAAEGEGLSAASVRVPDPGEWLARVWLEDAAGNQDSARAGDAVRLRFDDEAPTAVFEEQGPVSRAPCAFSVRRRLRRRGRDDRIAPARHGSWIDAGGTLSGAPRKPIDDLALAGWHIRAARAGARRSRQRAHRHTPWRRFADAARAAIARGRRDRVDRPHVPPQARGAAARCAAFATA